MTYFSLTAL